MPTVNAKRLYNTLTTEKVTFAKASHISDSLNKYKGL